MFQALPLRPSIVQVVESKEDFSGVFRVVNVLVSLLNVGGFKHAVDDRLEVTSLDTLNNACQLTVHHGFVGPSTHVDADDRAVSRHQS